MRELLSPLPSSVIDASHWWVALSGGADSVALLHALHALREEERGPSISAVHVNHGLHPDADAWAALCRRHCDALKIPLCIESVDVQSSGRGLEAAAREARYHAFEKVLLEGDVLFTAHHADDMVETVMLRLFRGAGPRGLAGIPRQRPCGKGTIFRPFLETPRALLYGAVTRAALEYVTDPSNLRVDQDRNYLRQVVIPAVEARWPGYRDTVVRAAQLQSQVQRRLSRLPLPLTHTIMGEPALEIDSEIDSELLAAQLHQWLSESATEVPDKRRLVEFARQALTAQPDRLPELAWNERCLRVWRGRVIDVSELEASQGLPENIVVGQALAGAWGELSWSVDESGPTLCEGATLTVVPSHRVASLTSPAGVRKPTHKWLQERDVPPWWRSQLPVLYDNNDPVWILPVGPLEGITARDAPRKGRGMTPVWRPFSAL